MVFGHQFSAPKYVRNKVFACGNSAASRKDHVLVSSLSFASAVALHVIKAQ